MRKDITRLMFMSFFALFLFGCGGSDAEPGLSDSDPGGDGPDDIEEVSAAEPAGTLYRFSGSTYHSVLRVNKSGEKEISFTIEASDDNFACLHEVKGVAKLKEGDMESREEDGEAYFVNEYVFESDSCNLSFAVEADDESMVWVNEWDCPLHVEPCPFEISGPLKRTSK